jgi:hypothetical protein
MNRHFGGFSTRAIFIPRLVALALSLVAGAVFTPAHASRPTPANLSWSLALFDFGSVAVGNTPSQTFTLTNMGGMSSGMIAVTESGSSTFVITDDRCTGKALGGGKSCSVTVQYDPTNTNGDTGTLSNTAVRGSAPSLSLYGNGTPNLVISPGTFAGTLFGLPAYDYNPVPGVTQTFTVSNTGTGTSESLQLGGSCGIACLTIIPGTDNCSGTSLAPNGSCTFNLVLECFGGFEGNGRVGVLPYIELVNFIQCP